MSEVFRAVTIGESKAFDDTKRSVTHLISSDRVDRAGDVIEQDGWDLRAFRKNAVVLQNHSYQVQDVIGRAEDVHVAKAGLTATTVFAETPTASVAYDLVRTGFAGAWSIGGRPLDSHRVEEGVAVKCERCVKAEKSGASLWSRHYIKTELLEYSLVAVPMNPDAVTYAVRRGLLPAEMVQRFAYDGSEGEMETRDGAVTCVELSGASASAIQSLIAKIGRANACAEIRRRAKQIKGD